MKLSVPNKKNAIVKPLDPFHFTKEYTCDVMTRKRVKYRPIDTTSREQSRHGVTHTLPSLTLRDVDQQTNDLWGREEHENYVIDDKAVACTWTRDHETGVLRSGRTAMDGLGPRSYR